MTDVPPEKDNSTAVDKSARAEDLPASPSDSPERAKDAKIVLELFSSEYKLLQDKIDKIGAFRFTVKGWSVTLVIVSTFAIGANKNADPRLLLLLIVFVVALGLVEWKQARLSGLFGKRLLKLEREFQRLRRILEPESKRRVKVGAAPGIAYELHDDARQRERTLWGRVIGRRAILNADLWFYLIQIFAVLGAVWVLLMLERNVDAGGQQITIIEDNNAIQDSSTQGSGR
jgi:hypothetical protein